MNSEIENYIQDLLSENQRDNVCANRKRELDALRIAIRAIDDVIKFESCYGTERFKYCLREITRILRIGNFYKEVKSDYQ